LLNNELPMDIRDQAELENMALAGELARQLVHDFGNFLNALRLQLEVCTRFPDKPTNWTRTKADVEELGHLIQEWWRFSPQTLDANGTELVALLREVAESVQNRERALNVQIVASSDSAWLAVPSADVRRLFFLLLHGLSCQPASDAVRPTVNIEVRPESEQIVVVFQCKGLDPSFFRIFEPDARCHTPLWTAACRSMAMRLDVSIQLRGGDALELAFRVPT
jgi:hypothetical protein